MPTTLPPRAVPSAKSLDFIDFVKVMMSFYAAIAMPVVAVVAIEHHLTGMSLAEIIMQATGSGASYSNPLLIGLF